MRFRGLGWIFVPALIGCATHAGTVAEFDAASASASATGVPDDASKGPHSAPRGSGLGNASGSGLGSAGGSRVGSASGSNSASGTDQGTGTGAGMATIRGDGGQSDGSDGAAPVTVDAGGAALVTYGPPYTGGVFNLGPVDYAETQWHNACAPGTKYDPRVQAVEGTLLGGLWGNIPNVAGYCDSCIQVTTAMGKSALLRVVTYGVTPPNSLDTSPSAFALLSSGEYPRAMTWEFAECPDTGPMLYEFQTASSEWWTSLWVRNARVPLAKVEATSANHPSWITLARGSDGTLTDASGFGVGSFTIRSTAVDGTTVSDTFTWPSSGIGGAFLTGKGNFQ